MLSKEKLIYDIMFFVENTRNVVKLDSNVYARPFNLRNTFYTTKNVDEYIKHVSNQEFNPRVHYVAYTTQGDIILITPSVEMEDT